MKGSLVIAEREIPGIMRNKPTLWILLTVAAVFALTILLKWPESGVSDLTGSQARGAFRSLAMAMLTAVVLVVPAFPATSLVKEIRRRTMELLLNSPLHRYEIFFGKALAMFCFILVLLTMTLPAMTCCFAMGGISLTADILRLYVLLIVVCLQLAVLGMLVGTWAGSPESALRWAYGCTFALVVGTLIPWQFLEGMEGPLGSIASFLRQLSPVPAMLQMVSGTTVSQVGLRDSSSLMESYFLYAGLFIVIGSGVCIRRFNYSLLDRSRSQGVITDELSSGGQVARRLFFLIDAQRRKAGIPFFLNPVMVKEFRSRQFGRLHWLLRLISSCAVLSLLLTFATTMGTVDWGVERIGGIIVIAQVTLIIVLTPGIAGGLISGEREAGGWDLLRTTPLSAGRILRGKLISVVLTLLLVLCASLPGYAVIMAIKPNLREQVMQVIVCLLFSAALSLLVSATVSAFVRSTAVATTISYGLLMLLFAGTLVVWSNLDAPFSHTFVERVLSVNPMAGALSAIAASGFETFDLVPRTWWTSGILCGLLLVILQLRTWRLCQPD